MTLIEILVVIALLGLIASLVPITLRRSDGPRAAPVDSLLQAARDEALRSGKSISVRVLIDSVVVAATALPDGSIVADPLLQVDRLSGRRSTALEGVAR